jgi:hypothetical protein
VHAIADDALQFPPFNPVEKSHEDMLMSHLSDPEQTLLEEVKRCFPDLATWEIKSLSVGHADVMKFISLFEGQEFPWKYCDSFCKNHHHRPSVRPGIDADNTPWTIPRVDSSLNLQLDSGSSK